MINNSKLTAEIKNYALKFVYFIINQEYHSAYNMLSIGLKTNLTPIILKDNYSLMTNNIQLSSSQIQYRIENELINWPTNQPTDYGWVYISLFSDFFSEAISVIIANEYENIVIREIEWGRP